MPLKNKTILMIFIGASVAVIAYMCWNKKKEWLSDLGLGTGMLNYGIGPTYEGYESLVEEPKKGGCSVCS